MVVPLSRYGRCTSAFSKLHSLKPSPLALSSSSSTTTAASTEVPSSSAAAVVMPVQSAAPPIRVAFTESAGRGVFATRAIGTGDLIHTAQPIISHPSISTTVNSVCYFCLKKLHPSPAHPQPPNARFCSQECRDQSKVFYDVEKRADWSAYDDYCRTRGLKYPLLVRRLASMVIAGAAPADSLDILQPATLSPAMISEMQEEFRMLRSAFASANVADRQMNFLTSQWYTDVLSRIRINAFRIELVGGSYEDLLSSAAASVEADGAVGNAIYMLPSFYNHDCDPNTHILWIENANARLKALRDIEAGEELRICYIDASMDYGARQTILLQGFGFHCCCFRCLSGY